MKKQSRWILLLSALLCLCMLFVSCAAQTPEEPVATEPTDTTPTKPQDTTDSNKPEAEEPIPSNEVIDYQALVGEWTKYLEFKAEEKEVEIAPLSAKKIFTENDDTKIYQGSDIQNDSIIVTRTINEVQDTSGTLGYTRRYTYNVYNMITGQKIVGDLTTTNHAQADVIILKDVECFIEVQIRKWLPVEGQTNTYGYHSFYDYYDFNGKKLTEKPLEKAIREYDDYTVNDQGLVAVVTAFDTSYLIDEPYSQILDTCKPGEERLRPEADFEYKGFKYLMKYDSVQIYDADDKLKADYTFSKAWEYDPIVRVLSNGNVLFIYEEDCDSNETDYVYADPYFSPYGSMDKKYDLSYVILNANTGDTTEASADYVIETLITPALGNGTNLTTKGDYQFAVIYKIADRTLATEPTFVILDNDMKIVAELPRILKNQTDVVKALNSRTMVIEASDSYYTVDLSNCKVSMYMDAQEYDFDWPIEGAFLKDEVLYNEKMEKLIDLSKVDSYEILNGEGKILAYEYFEGTGEVPEKHVWNLIYVQNGSLVKRSFQTGNEPKQSYLCDQVIWTEKAPGSGATRYYNADGSFLFEAKNYREDFRFVNFLRGESVYTVACTIGNNVVAYYTVQ